MKTQTRPGVFRARYISELATLPQRLAFLLWNGAALLLSSAAVTVLCLLLGLGMADIQIFFDYFRHPLLFLLNWLPVLLLQLLLYALFGRQYLAFLGSAALFLLAAVGGFYKLKFRGEPFLFSDLGAVSAALGVAGSFDLRPNVRLLLAPLGLLGGTLFLLLFVRGRPGKRLRLGVAVLVLLSLYPLWRFVYSSEALYYSARIASKHVVNDWVQEIQISRGIIYQFIYSAAESGSRPPAGYDEAAARALDESFTDAAIPESERVHLLIFQLEAFSDFNELGIAGIAPETYAGFYRLKAQGLSGSLVTDTFAGGSVRTERCFLTGSRQLLEYSRPAPSFLWYLNGQGYATVGSHPHYANFYNRVNVNRYLGFQDYWFSENHYAEALAALDDPWASDAILFPQAAGQLFDLAREGRWVFSFNVSMQGHGPYAADRAVYGEDFWPGEGYSPQVRYVVNNYLGSVHDTCERLAALAEELEASDEPVVLLVYGDHKPWLGDNDSVYRELGVDLDRQSREGFFHYYSTPWLIWANPAAEGRLGRELRGEGPALSPGFLMSYLFQQLGWQGSGYMQFQRGVMARMSVCSPFGGYIADGTFTTEPSEELAALCRDWESLHYYRLQHFTPPA